VKNKTNTAGIKHLETGFFSKNVGHFIKLLEFEKKKHLEIT
jgi:hypothetical protein